jgi:hypothetical protein
MSEKGELITGDEAVALVRQRLRDILPPGVQASFGVSAARPAALYVAPLGSDPDDARLWTKVCELGGLDDIPAADDGGI